MSWRRVCMLASGERNTHNRQSLFRRISTPTPVNCVVSDGRCRSIFHLHPSVFSRTFAPWGQQAHNSLRGTTSMPDSKPLPLPHIGTTNLNDLGNLLTEFDGFPPDRKFSFLGRAAPAKEAWKIIKPQTAPPIVPL